MCLSLITSAAKPLAAFKAIFIAPETNPVLMLNTYSNNVLISPSVMFDGSATLNTLPDGESTTAMMALATSLTCTVDILTAAVNGISILLPLSLYIAAKTHLFIRPVRSPGP